MNADELLAELRKQTGWGENKGVDLVAALGSTAASALVPALLSKAYISKAVPQFGKTLRVDPYDASLPTITPESMQTYDALAAEMGIEPLRSGTRSVIAGTHFPDDALITATIKPYPKMRPEIELPAPVNNPAVLPGRHTVDGKNLLAMGADPNDVPIIAHEFGHLKSMETKVGLLRRLILGLRKPGLLVSGLGTTGASFLPDEDHAQLATIGGTAGMAPVLADEFQASLDGYKGLRGARPDLSRLKALRTFVGMPTYAAAATAPLLAYMVARKLREQRGYS